MKNVFKLLFFVTYIIAIFSIKNHEILAIYILVNFIISKMFNTKFLGFLENIKILMILVIFTTIINMIFGSIEDGIVLGIRILIAYNFTYIFSCTFFTDLVDAFSPISFIFTLFDAISIISLFNISFSNSLFNIICAAPIFCNTSAFLS